LTRRPYQQAAQPPQRFWGLLWLTFLLGALLFIWRLGYVGQLDETPALFAAAGRAMAETGDWLTPRVNGHPRFDKPVLIYWLIGVFTRLLPPAWDPLGSWAANLPSALATVLLMLALADTVAPRRAALVGLTAALTFALSPLVLLWGRVSVSDPLLTACLALALLGFWRAYANPRAAFPWLPWLFLALAVLTKGPVALLLSLATLLLFGWLQRDIGGLTRALRPLPGLLVVLLLALPWYLIEFLREGEPFVQSFFGYHNLQRFTQVVNHHAGPWWFYAPVLLIASLPVSPLLLLGIAGQWPGIRRRQPLRPAQSLNRFALAWLFTVVCFFSLSATKLASYLLPGLPAMALLVALADGPAYWLSRARWASLGLASLMAALLLASPLWLSLLQDPEIPGLAAELLSSGLVLIGGICFLLAALLGGFWQARRPSSSPGAWLLALQLPLVAWQILCLIPIAEQVDRLRQLPVRSIAAAVQQHRRAEEAVAMVGINKPSLHYYSRQVVVYEARPAPGLVNLAERLGQGGSAGAPATALVVIDASTAALPHWRGVDHRLLDREGIYLLWRLPLQELRQRAAQLAGQGVKATWKQPNPERY
jgi:4-amino-4-deoxy-L-arabinose transferase-like glycosyltransferase